MLFCSCAFLRTRQNAPAPAALTTHLNPALIKPIGYSTKLCGYFFAY